MQSPQEKQSSLLNAAAALQRIAPIEWQLFSKAFAEFAEHHRDNLVTSPLPDIAVNQGRAQILARLSKDFTNPSAEADKLKKAKP